VLKIRKLPVIIAGVAVIALLYAVGGAGFGPGRSSQGRVLRAEVTLDVGSFAVQLTTRSSVHGERDWVTPGKTYTGTYVQDVLLDEGEIVNVWLTAATDIDRHVPKRTLRCQLYDNGKPIPGEGQDSRPVRRGEAGEPASCRAVVRG
jgi:hypothetical protein